MTTSEALTLAGSAIDRLDAQYLLADLLQTGRASLLAHPERELKAEEAAAFQARVAERARGVPVAYLIGRREFYGHNFFVSDHVLIPRPETEMLVEQALARLSEANGPGSRASARVLDLGTGSGAVAITLALERPAARVTACDVSAGALAVAQRNASQLGASVEFLASDWFAALANRTFDLVVSNPPYVAANDAHLTEGDLRFEPKSALTDGSADGLDSIRTIVTGAPAHLNPGGWLLFEHGYDQASACRELLLKAGFENLISIVDLANIPRVAGGQIR